MKKMMKMIAAIVMILAISVPTFAQTQDQYLDSLTTLELFAMTYNLEGCTEVMTADPSAFSTPASVLKMKKMTGEKLSQSEEVGWKAIELFADQISGEELGTLAWIYGPSGTYKDTAVDCIFTIFEGNVFIEATTFFLIENECYLVTLPYGLTDTGFVLLKEAITCKKV